MLSEWTTPQLVRSVNRECLAAEWVLNQQAMGLAHGLAQESPYGRSQSCMSVPIFFVPLVVSHWTVCSPSGF